MSLETSISLPRIVRAQMVRRLLRPRRIAVGAGVGVVLLAGAFALSRTHLFHVRAIEVTGIDHLTRSSVLQTAGISRGTNALWLDEGKAERRLEDLPWVASANVEARLTLGVEIRVVERTPIAVASDGINVVLMAGDGTALGPAGPGLALPRIVLPVRRTFDTADASEATGPSPVGAARAIGAMPPELRTRVSRVTVLPDQTLELRISDGPTVRFGSPRGAGRKGKTILALMAWAEREGTALRELSVVAPSAPAAVID